MLRTNYKFVFCTCVFSFTHFLCYTLTLSTQQQYTQTKYWVSLPNNLRHKQC